MCRGYSWVPLLPRMLSALRALYKELVPELRAANTHISAGEGVQVEIELWKRAVTPHSQPSCINYFRELNTLGLWLSHRDKGKQLFPALPELVASQLQSLLWPKLR